MSMDEIKKEFLLYHVSENPDFKLEDLEKTTTSDEDWVKSQEFQHTNDTLQKVFEGKLEELQKNTEEANKVNSPGLSPLEATRNKVKVSVKSKFSGKKIENMPVPLGGNDEEFEEVFRETNQG